MRKSITLTGLLFALLTFASPMCKLYAQQNVKATQNGSVQNLELARAAEKRNAALQAQPHKRVYENYKGIANQEEAKKAWIKDNPDAYKKSIQPVSSTGVSH